MEKRSTPSLQITDRFGAQAAYASLRLPDGTEATVPAEHAAAIYVNEQPAFRVVCTPALLPQLALGRLLTEGWIASADEVEQIAVCAEGAKVQVYLHHPLPTRRAAAQEVASCCTDNIALGSPGGAAAPAPCAGAGLAAGMGADPDRRHARRSAAVPRHPGGAQLLCAAQRGNCFCLRGSGAAQRAG